MRNKFLIFLLGIFLLSSVSALVINTSGGSFLCYQETANLSNSADGSCSLNYSGNYFGSSAFIASADYPISYDGNFNTGGSSTWFNTQYLLVNYTKPSFYYSENPPLWITKAIYTNPAIANLTNVTILSSCYSQDPLSLRFHFNTAGGEECWNGSSFVSITSGGSNPKTTLYEEALAWNFSKFSNNENLTISSSINRSRYLVVPDTISTFTHAYLNLTGFNSSLSLNYQEFAQQYATTAGICEGGTDGNWNSYNLGGVGSVCIMYYTIPSGNISNVIWQVSDADDSGGSGQEYTNLTIPSACLNNPTTGGKLVLSYTNDLGGFDNHWRCLNGTYNIASSSNWTDLRTDVATAGRIYEEAIIWNGSFYPTNLNIYIADTNSYNFTLGNVTNIRTTNLASYLNLYLNQEYLSGSNYLIPFIFTSLTNGIIQYSDLLFSNDGFLENSISYTNPITEGQTNTITGNFTFGQFPDSIILNYNGTNSTPSVAVTGNNYLLTSSVVSPFVSSDQNISIYYIFITNGTLYSTTPRNQTVQNVQLTTNCTSNFNVLNLQNYDEETLASMNGTVEYYLNLESNDNQISYINGNSTGNNISLCSNLNLTSSAVDYSLQLRYYADGYAYETYNIQPTAITNLPLNISLYFLNDSIGQQFTISYVDFNYLTYPNAVMQIQRQYLSENVYRVVELPKLDNNGDSVATFNRNNIRYKIIVTNNGEILDTFEDIFPVCQNIVLGQCEISLRGVQSDSSTTTGDFTYTLVKSDTDVTLTYIIPSGTPRSIQFITNQSSRFLTDVSSCSSTLFASGGTITCGYNQTVGDSVINAQIINSDGTTLYSSIPIGEDLSAFFLLNNFFIGFILILSLALMFVSSGVILILVAIVGLMFLGLILLLKGMSIITLAGSLGWLVVAGVIIIYKISQKEEKT